MARENNDGEGMIRISLEAEVTEANCNTDIEAQILQKSGNTRMDARELVLAMRNKKW